MFFTRLVMFVTQLFAELKRIYNAPPPAERPPRVNTVEQLLLMPLLDKIPTANCADFDQQVVDMVENAG